MSLPQSPSTEKITLVPIEQIGQSIFVNLALRNKEIADLADSISEQGMLTPIVVTDMPHNIDNGMYEIIMGHRRLLAAKALEWTHLPCIIKQMDDRQILLAQCAENAQRLDDSIWSQADYIGKLMTEEAQRPALTIKEVAHALGKTQQWVGRRFQISKIEAEVRANIPKGFSDLHIELLAQFSDAIQRKILKEAKHSGQPLENFAEFKRFTKSFQRNFDTAIFDPKNAELYPHAGACTTCPMRRNNRPDLFEVGSAKITKDDCCLNSICWGKKTALHFDGVRVQISGQYLGAQFASDLYGNRPEWVQPSHTFFAAKEKQKPGDVPVYFFTGQNAGKVLWFTPIASAHKKKSKLPSNASPKEILKEKIAANMQRTDARRKTSAIQKLLAHLEKMPAPENPNVLLALLTVFGTNRREKYLNSHIELWKKYNKAVGSGDTDGKAISKAAWEQVLPVLISRLKVPGLEYVQPYTKEALHIAEAFNIDFSEMQNEAVEAIKPPAAIDKLKAEMKALNK